jgi:ABC-type sugar transport system permease subunit
MTAVTIPLGIAVTVVAAVFANGILRGKGFFRVNFFYPVIMEKLSLGIPAVVMYYTPELAIHHFIATSP